MSITFCFGTGGIGDIVINSYLRERKYADMILSLADGGSFKDVVEANPNLANLLLTSYALNKNRRLTKGAANLIKRLNHDETV